MSSVKKPTTMHSFIKEVYRDAFSSDSDWSSIDMRKLTRNQDGTDKGMSLVLEQLYDLLQADAIHAQKQIESVEELFEYINKNGLFSMNHKRNPLCKD